MASMTESEWERVREALVKGGLRECIESLLTTRSLIAEGLSSLPLLQISDKNRMLIYRAYDDGDGNTVVLKPDVDGYFTGFSDEYEVMSGIEIDGVLYSICHESGGGSVRVLVGEAIVENQIGVIFDKEAEARAYIKGLSAK